MPHCPPNHADHAEDIGHRIARELDYFTSDRMAELGIPTGQIGSRMPGQSHFSFMPPAGVTTRRAA